MPPKNHKRGTPTDRQTAIFQYFESLPEDCARQTITAEHFNISSANVLKARRAYKRNTLLVMGFQVPDLNDLMKLGACSNDNDSCGRVGIVHLATQDGVSIDRASPPLGAQPSALLQPSDGDDFESETPVPRNIFATGEKVIKRRKIALPSTGLLTLIITSAQDGTTVHEDFWVNLTAYIEWLKVHSKGAGAELIVSGFTYNKSMFGGNHEKSRPYFLCARELHCLDEKEARKLVFFDARVEEHWSDDRIELDGLLDICAECNTQPTAVNPLSGFQTYTNGRWGIFPHAKHQLESVSRMPDKPYKANVTTGTCTLPNYIAKKAGQKAEQHHTIGAVIVECTPEGYLWVRNIAADPDTGAFHDADRRVSDGVVTEGHSVATISYGDVHHEKLDPEVARATWGYCPDRGKTIPAWRKQSLLDRLRPEHQFFHDVSDFAPRNHHNVSDPHFLAITHFRNEASVEHELSRVARFLDSTSRPWCQSVVVQSNHDNAFLKWVKNADVRQDPENGELWHRSNATVLSEVRKTGTMPRIFELTIRDLAPKRSIDGVLFIDEQDSYEVHGIEHSQHGHLGANGSRGSPLGLSKVAPKMTTGHTHSPSIRDGLFTSGVCQMDMKYNVGPTSWAIAHTIGHHDGTRQILFFNGGQFFAPRD